MGIYSARDVQISVPAIPKVDREQALRKARGLVDYVPAKESIALDIGPDLTGQQMLRWTIRFEGGTAQGSPNRDPFNTEIVIDALSGEVSTILQWS